MRKKILIGSIIAVVILVLVSFTGVIGYRTTKSSTIAIASPSPLFSIRSTRAIDEESKDLTCDYVGKGEESVLSIPKRDDRTELLQKFIERISKMDDITFNLFKKTIVNHIHQDDTIREIGTRGIINALLQIRNNPIMVRNNIILNKPNNRGNMKTIEITYISDSYLLCLLGYIILFLSAGIDIILSMIFTFFWERNPTSAPCCSDKPTL